MLLLLLLSVVPGFLGSPPACLHRGWSCCCPADGGDLPPTRARLLLLLESHDERRARLLASHCVLTGQSGTPATSFRASPLRGTVMTPFPAKDEDPRLPFPAAVAELGAAAGVGVW